VGAGVAVDAGRRGGVGAGGVAMSDDVRVIASAAERVAQELATRYAEMFPSCDQTIRAVGVAAYLRGHADASASLRELQQAAGEYRAASDELAAADAAYRLAGMSSDRGAYKDASSRLTTAEARLHAHDAALAALLPSPAEPTKETP
jgi:hypothetical protein